MPSGANIRNLPRVDTINIGDLLIVDTDQGTRTIDFGDVVISKDQVSFAAQLSSMESAIGSNTLRTTTITGALLEGKQTLYVYAISSANPLSGKEIWLRREHTEEPIKLRVGNPDVLEVTGNVSAANVVYASGGNSVKWNSNYSTTNLYSAGWTSALTEVQLTSGSWASVNTDLGGNSAHWNSAYTTVCAQSAAWGGGASKWTEPGGSITYLTNTGNSVGIGVTSPEQKLTVGGAVSAATIVYAGHGGITPGHGDSRQWHAAYNTVKANSGGWGGAAATGWVDDGTVVRLNTASDKVGIGTVAPNHELTVIGNISATGDIYANNNSYKFLDGTSWSAGDVTNLKSTSGTWVGVDTTVRDNSAAWADNQADLTNIANASGGWDSTKTTVDNGEAVWNSTNTDVNANSADWETAATRAQSVDTTLNANSARWNSVTTDVNANSGDWMATETTVRASSGGWDNTANNIFKTFTIDSQSGDADLGDDVVADSSTDTITLCAGPNIALISDHTTDTISISASTPATGGVDGSGASNSVPKWSDTDTLTNSIITEVGSKIGVDLGSSNPGEKLTVAGSISALNVVYANGGNSDEWNSARTTLEATSGTWNSSGTINHCASARRLTYYPAAGTTVDDVDEVYWDDTNDRLGIKERFPTEALTIAGNISARGSLSATGTDDNWIQGSVGIGIQSPPKKLTVIGDISASGSIYNASGVIGGESVQQGNDAYTTVNANSSTWNTAATDVSNNKVNWTNTHTQVNGNSGGWENTETVLRANSAIWTYVANNSSDNTGGGWTDGGTDVYVTDITKDVGIGVTAPEVKLTVSGDISASGGLSALGGFNYLDGSVGIGAENNLQYKLSVVTNDSDDLNGLLIDQNDTGSYYGVKIDSEAGTAAMLVQGAGVTVTQDITDTQGLYVSRNISETGSNPLVSIVDDNTTNTQTTLKVQQDGTGNIVSLFDGGTEVFTVADGGKVGVGTTSPNHELTVIGNVSATGTIYGTIDSNDTAQGDSAHTTVNANSAKWDNTNTTVNGSSGEWDGAKTTLRASSGDWENTQSTVNANSAAWASTAAGGWSDGGAVVSLQTAGDLVSIGTTASGEKLTVAGGISGRTVYFNNGLSGTGDSKFGTVNPIVIKSSTGQLGVNKEPSATLDVDGTAAFTSVGVSTPHFSIAAQGTTDLFTVYDGIAADNRVAFIVKDGGKVGLGTDNPTTTLTVSGSISAQGDIYVNNNSIVFADGNSLSTEQLSGSDSAVTNIRANSGNWEGAHTLVNSNSSDWIGTETIVRANSSSWDGINVITLSGNGANGNVTHSNNDLVLSAGAGISITQTSNTISISSTAPAPVAAAQATAAYTTSHDNSGRWDGVWTTVYNVSGDWQNVRSTVNVNSGSWGGNGWQDDGTIIRLGTTTDNVVIGDTDGSEKLTVAGNISGRDIVYAGGAQYVQSNSLQWHSVYNHTNANSGDWDTTYTRVNSAHNEWDKANTTLRATSGEWEGTESTVRANSGTWNVALTSVGFTRNVTDSIVSLTNSSDKVGIGVSSDLTNELTVAGTISAQTSLVTEQVGIGDGFWVRSLKAGDVYTDGYLIQMPSSKDIYLSGGRLTAVCDVSSTGAFFVQHGTTEYSSVDWSVTTIDVTSGKTAWDSVYDAVNSLSSTWNASNSADTPKYDGVYTTVNSNSSDWNKSVTNYKLLSGVQSAGNNLLYYDDTLNEITHSGIYVKSSTITFGGVFGVNDLNNKVVVDGGLSARTVNADTFKTTGLSGMTTSVVVKLSGTGTAVLNFTNGILTSVT